MNSIQLLQWITFISLVLWLLIYWQAGWKIFIDIRNALKSGISRMDSILLIVMALLTIVLTLTALMTILGQVKFGLPRRPEFSAWWPTIGCILTVIGVIGTFYCRYQLGPFWTAEIGLKQEHRVIDQGVYAVIRHPIYAFAILLYIGLGLVFHTWWNILAAAVVVLCYMLKAADEDAFLGKNLAGYNAYKKRVRYRLIPKIW
jgi:protein-S-isoprenylcysteine O-methyltransferase Ste14